MTPFRLGLLTALWRRPRLTAAVLDYYAGLSVPGVRLFPLAVRSAEDPEPTVLIPEAWRYVTAPNRPLSMKWNAGMEALKNEGLDGVMIVGSDDLVTAEYFAEAARRIRAGSDLVLFDTMHVADAETGRAMVIKPRRLGGGRTLSASLLDSVGWRPWPDDRDRRLDGGMDRRLHLAGRGKHRKAESLVRADDTPGAVLLDVKSPVNMWSYDDLTTWQKSTDPCPSASELLATHFPSAHPQILAMAAEKTDLKDRLAELHKGGGYYELPDGTTVRGASKAEAALRAQLTSGPAAESAPAEATGTLRATKNIPSHLLPAGLPPPLQRRRVQPADEGERAATSSGAASPKTLKPPILRRCT